MVQLSDPYMTTRKKTALTRWTFVSTVMSLLLNMFARFVICLHKMTKHPSVGFSGDRIQVNGEVLNSTGSDAYEGSAICSKATAK